MSFRDELLRRAQEYTQRNDLVLGEELGFGVHGIVFVTESQRQKDPSDGRSAIKVHQREPDYRRERDVYLRLREKGIASIRRCHVPQLLHYDDQVWIIEMTVVSPPFVLDFAGAFLDIFRTSQKKSSRIGKRRNESSSVRAGRKSKLFFGT